MRTSIVLGMLAIVGCEGAIDTGSRDGSSGDSGIRVELDGAAGSDAASAPDAFVPPIDSGPPDPGTCSMGPPLSEPIAGCAPAPLPSTGDPHEDCWRRINQFRCECQHLPPLARWIEGEACADQMAMYDHDHRAEGAHAAFRARICDGGYGQNECPGWGSIDQTVSGCLQQMWDEGPGDFYGPPPHGHYINMSSTSFSGVACGFYEGSAGVYAIQNFH